MSSAFGWGLRNRPEVPLGDPFRLKQKTGDRRAWEAKGAQVGWDSGTCRSGLRKHPIPVAQPLTSPEAHRIVSRNGEEASPLCPHGTC